MEDRREMNDTERQESGARSATPAYERPRIPWPILLGVAVGLVLPFVALRLYQSGKSLPELTPETLAAAQSRWDATGLQDYRVEVRVQARETERYAVEVRDGDALQAWRNERPLTQRRVFDTWSIPGMFSTMADDLDRAARAKAGTAPPGSGQLMLRCEFDETTGAPLEYHRIEWGSHLEVRWQIVRLVAVEGEGEGRTLVAH
jgi:hypothetical protein